RRTWHGRRQRDDDRPVYAAVAAMDVSGGGGRDSACPECPANLRGRRLQPDQRVPDPVGICRRNLIPALHDRRLVLSASAVVGSGHGGEHERAREQPDDCGDNYEPVPHVTTSLDRSPVYVSAKKIVKRVRDDFHKFLTRGAMTRTGSWVNEPRGRAPRGPRSTSPAGLSPRRRGRD